MKKFPLIVLGLILIVLIFKTSSNNPLTLGAQQTKTSEVKGILNLETSNFGPISNNGIGSSPAESTLLPTTSFVKVECQDPDGCKLNIDSTNSQSGDLLVVQNAATSTGTLFLIIIDAPEGFPLSSQESRGLIFEGTGWNLF